MRYRFTHSTPLIFRDLHHGVNAIVHRLNPLDDADGAQVVLHPGDVIEVEEPLSHPHLAADDSEAIDAAQTAAAASVPDATPSTEPTTETTETQGETA